MNIPARGAGINGFQEAGKSQEYALNARALIGIRRGKINFYFSFVFVLFDHLTSYKKYHLFF